MANAILIMFINSAIFRNLSITIKRKEGIVQCMINDLGF